ncbi:MAG TPA: 16S rRNA (guanine(527)-N(7))-methyltransferase RsmG [Deltaproteobacteria bacterium]|nr:16S rRNA (guanine(527)-N(7))-methyltransferase RsmG [Deltaproteobacteria bacterium]HCY11338.1 16S rRNA (guanine(527)-N(7))-methyltransferase RsmG [Deltaproteobacteria bacterium]
MKNMDQIELLKKGALELGVALDDSQAAAFLTYLRELKVWNKKINLTAIEDEKDIIIKHFLDSLTPFGLFSEVRSVLDMGAGAGFPGIPLKIAMPELRLTLLDSVEKKVNFMKHIIRTLGLKGAEAIAGRAEAPDLAYRLAGSFDCVISRAFTELPAFMTLGLPYLRPGGMLLAMKGPAVAEEINALGVMKGVLPPESFEVAVPFSDRKTTLVVIRKV